VGDTGDVGDLTRNYRAAFQRYLPRRSEAALTLGYQLGREAVVESVSLLDLVQVHHLVLAEVLDDTRDEDLRDVTSAAAEFLVEVLSTFDMAHRGLRDGLTSSQPSTPAPGPS
jgi:hypothetical protein